MIQLKDLLNRKIIRHLFAMSGALALAQFFNFIIIAYSSKLFGPELFGQYSFVNGVSLTLSVVFCLRGEHFVLASEREKIKEITRVVSKASIILLLLILFTLLLILPFYKDKIHLILIAAGVILGFIYSHFGFWGSVLIRINEISFYSATCIFRPLLMGGIQSFLFFAFGKLSFILIFSRFFSDLFSTLSRVCFCRRKNKDMLTMKINTLDFLMRKKEFFIFGSVAGLINVFSQQLPILALPSFYGYDVIGQFSLAFSLSVVPMTLILSPLRNLLIKHFNESKQIKNTYQQFTTGLLIPSTLIIFLAQILSEPIVSLIWGDEWNKTAFFLKLISVWVATGLLNSPSFALIVYKEKQGFLIKLESVFLVLKIVSILFAVFFEINFDILVIILVFLGVAYNVFLILHTKMRIIDEAT